MRATFVSHPRAGHRPTLPDEAMISGCQPLARGGTPVADPELGALIWAELAAVLDLDT